MVSLLKGMDSFRKACGFSHGLDLGSNAVPEPLNGTDALCQRSGGLLKHDTLQRVAGLVLFDRSKFRHLPKPQAVTHEQ